MYVRFDVLTHKDKRLPKIQTKWLLKTTKLRITNVKVHLILTLHRYAKPRLNLWSWQQTENFTLLKHSHWNRFHLIRFEFRSLFWWNNKKICHYVIEKSRRKQLKWTQKWMETKNSSEPNHYFFFIFFKTKSMQWKINTKINVNFTLEFF